ncbi:hypothetical protein [Hydrogenimonas sp.]
MKRAVVAVCLPIAVLAYTKSAAPEHAKWADIVVKGKECGVKIWQGKHHVATGVIKSTSGKVQKMAVIIKNKRAEGDIRVESECEIVKIDFSDNAVGKPVKRIKNRVLWEWKIIRD